MADAAPPPRDSRGFTLIEVLVAFTILVLALAALMPGFSTGIAAVRVGGDTVRAVDYARALLAGTGHRGVIAVGQFDDRLDDGRFTSHLVVRPYSEAPIRGAGLYSVAVTVSWRDGTAARSVTLTSLRYAEAR